MPVDTSDDIKKNLADQATQLLKKINRDDNGLTLTDKIRNREIELDQTIDEFKFNYYKRNVKEPGVSSPSISNYRTTLKLIAEYPNFSSEDRQQEYDAIVSLVGTVNKINKALNFIESFVYGTSVPKMQRKVIPSETPTTIKRFAHCEWYAYFLYYRKSKLNKEPMIGRAKVSIDGDHKVTFLNTGVDQSVNYKGDYLDFSQMNNGILIFDLDCMQEEQGRNLHIKLFNRKPDQEVCVGGYETYENSIPQGGVIVFQKINDTNRDLPVGGFSFFHKHEEFENTIPEQIREFLSLRSMNYFLIPDDVKDLDSLSSGSDFYRLQYEKDALFLEKPVPVAFVSYPIFGGRNYDEALLNNIEEGIQDEFRKNGKEKIKVIAHSRYEGFAEDNTPRPDVNLEELKTSRFFIFFSDGVQKISYSYFQLAWALLFCKVVIIVGKRADFSETVLNINKNLIKKVIINSKSDLKTEWESGSILTRLKKIIYGHLPETLDGTMKNL